MTALTLTTPKPGPRVRVDRLAAKTLQFVGDRMRLRDAVPARCHEPLLADLRWCFLDLAYYDPHA